MNKNSYKPLSLSQHFEAPEGYRGAFGWMCGYSADEFFLNNIAERFTGNTKAQRAHLGKIQLALMLDPGNPQISPVEVPSVAHLPIKQVSNKPFKLLHAKVALLGFSSKNDWSIRLIVSTGNWTVQTLEESLDLAWRIDISSKELKQSEKLGQLEDDFKLRCADVKAADSMLRSLMACFDQDLLNCKNFERQSETSQLMEKMHGWTAQCVKAAQGYSRFFDNRKSSFLKQLPEMINLHAKPVRRNYLGMGSGFYESTAAKDQIPVVLEKIVNSLKEEKLLTSEPDLGVYVNPDACQAVANSIPALLEQGYSVYAAGVPAQIFGRNQSRTLHAKFLFSANYRENSSECSSAWIYLGSGNLTLPGFAKRMSLSQGNLEAGVIFSDQSLYWKKEGIVQADRILTNLLPVQWDQDVAEVNKINSGSDMPDRDKQYEAPPIAYLIVKKQGEEKGHLLIPPNDSVFEILHHHGTICPQSGEGFFWEGGCPRQVDIRWSTDGGMNEAMIPVIDELGRIAATELPQLDIDEALWQLANFPMAPDEEDLVVDAPDSEWNPEKLSHGNSPVSAYPIRQMMEFVESIAEKQTNISELDWYSWCNRLEQILTQSTESKTVQTFRELGINPLSPLMATPFRPKFAESNESPAGEVYAGVIDRVAQKWGVIELDPFGGEV